MAGILRGTGWNNRMKQQRMGTYGMKRIKAFAKKETVLSAAIVLALVSMVLVKPDKEYLAYMDYRTMGLLFCLMTVMAGFNRLGVFRAAGGKLLGRVSRAGCVAAVLVYLCFFFSMIITNDVALITFVPFGITVLKMAGMEAMVVPVVLLQTIGANLGSMMTPVGNPQNLYLYSRAGIPALDFVGLMMPYTLASFSLLGIGLIIVGRLFRGLNAGKGKHVPGKSCPWDRFLHTRPSLGCPYAVWLICCRGSFFSSLSWRQCGWETEACCWPWTIPCWRPLGHFLSLLEIWGVSPHSAVCWRIS